MAPGERAVVEGVRDGGQLFERAAHAADLLELAAGDAEALARVVVDADEAEPEVGATEEERPGEAAEDAATEGLLTGEATEQRIEQLDAQVTVQAAALPGTGRDEELRRDEIYRRRRLHEITCSCQ